MWAMSPNLRIKLRKGDFGGERSHFFLVFHGREEERVERQAPTSLHDLWSSVARFSLGQELKSIYVTKAMHGYRKQRISSKIQAKSSRDHGFWDSRTSDSFVFAL